MNFTNFIPWFYFLDSSNCLWSLWCLIVSYHFFISKFYSIILLHCSLTFLGDFRNICSTLLWHFDNHNLLIINSMKISLACRMGCHRSFWDKNCENNKKHTYNHVLVSLVQIHLFYHRDTVTYNNIIHTKHLSVMNFIGIIYNCHVISHLDMYVCTWINNSL